MFARVRRYGILSLVISAVALSGCLATGPGGSSDPLASYSSARVRNVDGQPVSYAQTYTMQGAGVGALAGAGLGYAVGRDTEAVLIGAAIGGILGGLVGNNIGRTTEDMAAQQLTAEEALQRVTLELDQATAARRQAEQVVAEKRTQLHDASADYRQRRIDAQQMGAVLKDAQVRLAQMQGASDRLGDAIGDVEQRLQVEGAGNAKADEMRRQRDQLSGEKVLLERQIAALTSELSQAPAVPVS